MKICVNSYILFSGIEPRFSKNKSEFLQKIQDFEIHDIHSQNGRSPNIAEALSEQLSSVRPNAHFFIFTDNTINIANDLIGTIEHMNAATVSSIFLFYSQNPTRIGAVFFTKADNRHCLKLSNLFEIFDSF